MIAAHRQHKQQDALPKKSSLFSPAVATSLSRSHVPAKSCACGGSCPRCRGGAPIQAKLRVNEPGDVYEREADRVADAVVGGGGSSPQLKVADNALQRLSAAGSPTLEDSDTAASMTAEEETPVQRLKAPGAETVGTVGQLPVSGGSPLPAPLAQTLGSRIGADFSAVRVHDDATSTRLADNLSARAFTSGAHVYFGAGEYRPETRNGVRTLAHELAHVVQQGAAPRSTSSPVSPSSGASPVQRMSVLDHTSKYNILGTNIRPWGSRIPDAIGNNYRVYTDGGNEVPAWVPYSGVPTDHRYWCHGFSLGTYNRWMYSVYSGSGAMGQVVADEYTPISASSTVAGDLAVWNPSSDGTAYGHSAKFTSPVTSGGSLNVNSSMLDSKNGPQAFNNFSLADLITEYGSSYSVYRHK